MKEGRKWAKGSLKKEIPVDTQISTYLSHSNGIWCVNKYMYNNPTARIEKSRLLMLHLSPPVPYYLPAMIMDVVQYVVWT